MSKFPQKPYDPAGAKHSPGPWWREQDCYIYSQGMDPVARVFVRGSKTSPAQDEAYLNACLITAAPELLESLRECMIALGKMGANTTIGPNRQEWVNARAAIAKAEGR